jgi:hypothetical protein
MELVARHHRDTPEAAAVVEVEVAREGCGDVYTAWHSRPEYRKLLKSSNHGSGSPCEERGA